MLFYLVLCNTNICHKDLETELKHFDSISPVFLILFHRFLFCSMLFLELAVLSVLFTHVICKIVLCFQSGMVNIYLFYLFIKQYSSLKYVNNKNYLYTGFFSFS